MFTWLAAGTSDTWPGNCSMSQQGARQAMLRLGIGLALLSLLFMTYWLHPATAWVVVGATFTLAVANRVRQYDAEAEGALQRVEE